MDMPWGDEKSKKFVTNVGLITSRGIKGDNIMAAEWTRLISYMPGFIMVNVMESATTYENIVKSKEFGVNIAAEDQNIICSVAGGSHGKDVGKIAVLREMGAEFYDAKRISVPMVKGASLNAECRLVKTEKFGSHMMLIGEVLEVSVGTKEPIVYHGNKYYKVGGQIHKPPQDVLDKMAALAQKHRRI